jgi:hypothetical protein
VLDVLAPSRMNPLPQISMIFTRDCGSDSFAKALFSDAANVLDVLAPSRMNPLPQISMIFTRYCGSEFIRESFIFGRRQCVGCSGPFADESASPTICMRHCGSEFIREYGISSDKDGSNVQAISRMNSLPQLSSGKLAITVGTLIPRSTAPPPTDPPRPERSGPAPGPPALPVWQSRQPGSGPWRERYPVESLRRGSPGNPQAPCG